jgi:Protein of unknown function (DUF1571)
MKSVSHSNRFGRVQIVASTLLCGGICAISLPWLLSAFAETQEARPFVLPQSGQTRFQSKVPLPTEDLHGKAALECNLNLLREGLRLLEQTSDYAGTFRKQERVNGVLDNGSLIQVKGRHRPLSLYLKWLEGDVGRELLYVENERDGEMLVKLGGLRGRFLPTLKFHPDSEQVRERVRHHVSHLSILNLTKQVIEHGERDHQRFTGLQCELLANDGGDLIRMTTNYDSPAAGGEYRKAMHFIDRGTLLPVKILTYGWPDTGQAVSAEDLDAETLLEHYEYSDLQFDVPLGDEDFREDNREYAFHRGK